MPRIWAATAAVTILAASGAAICSTSESDSRNAGTRGLQKLEHL